MLQCNVAEVNPECNVLDIVANFCYKVIIGNYNVNYVICNVTEILCYNNENITT